MMFQVMVWLGRSISLGDSDMSSLRGGEGERAGKGREGAGGQEQEGRGGGEGGKRRRRGGERAGREEKGRGRGGGEEGTIPCAVGGRH